MHIQKTLNDIIVELNKSSQFQLEQINENNLRKELNTLYYTYNSTYDDIVLEIKQKSCHYNDSEIDISFKDKENNSFFNFKFTHKSSDSLKNQFPNVFLKKSDEPLVKNIQLFVDQQPVEYDIENNLEILLSSINASKPFDNIHEKARYIYVKREESNNQKRIEHVNLFTNSLNELGVTIKNIEEVISTPLTKNELIDLNDLDKKIQLIINNIDKSTIKDKITTYDNYTDNNDNDKKISFTYNDIVIDIKKIKYGFSSSTYYFSLTKNNEFIGDISSYSMSMSLNVHNTCTFSNKDALFQNPNKSKETYLILKTLENDNILNNLLNDVNKMIENEKNTNPQQVLYKNTLDRIKAIRTDSTDGSNKPQL